MDRELGLLPIPTAQFGSITFIVCSVVSHVMFVSRLIL